MTKKAQSSTTTVTRMPSKAPGREVWRVTTDGKQQTHITTSTSTTVLDAAMVRFGPALKRLADR